MNAILRSLFTAVFSLSFLGALMAQQFTTNGSTVQLSCECYQLTADVNAQGGSAWNNNQISLNNPFDFHFRVYLGCNDNPGADGICFILQNSNTGVSSTGGGLGYANFPNQSIGIELDTHQNTGVNDPPEDHVAMESNGNTAHNLVAPVQASATSANIEDCTWHDFHVVWDPATQTMTVSFDGVQRFTYTFATGLVNSVFLGNPMVYWGWTGATGGESNLQQFCVDFGADFQAGSGYASCDPANVPFTSTSQSGLNNIVAYDWDFGDGSAHATTANAVHTFPGPGTYTVVLTITDQTLCTSSRTYAVVIHDKPVATPSQTNVDCYGNNNGTATVGVSSGKQPYAVVWTGAVGPISPNGPTNFTATQLAPGSYSATVTDSNGCSAAPVNFTITQPAAPLSVTASHINVTCFGAHNGSLTIDVSGGTPPYAYQGTNVPAGTTVFNNLGPALYAGNVTDANGCTAAVSETITEPSLLTAQETHTNIACYGDATGTMDITANGGTPNYTYNWNPNVSSGSTATGLTAGPYSVTVSDANSCTAVVSATLTEPPLLVLAATSTNILCYGGTDGTITATATGGNGTLNYSATTDGVNFVYSANGQFGGLTAGNYTVAVTDQNGCSKNTQVTIIEPTQLTALLQSYPVGCYHYHNGTTIAAASGGTPGYTYTFSDGRQNTSGIFGNLGAGSYDVTVTDASNCTITGNSIITEPDSVIISVSPDPVEVKLGDELPMQTTTNQSGNIVYTWTPRAGLSCYDCPNPVFDGVYSQLYTVTAVNDSGCRGTYSPLVKVIPVYDVFLPNAITPNGDGANDVWQMFGNLHAIKQLELEVFNRWGEKVYDTHDVYFKWDPLHETFKGAAVQPGVYVYQAKLVWLDNHSDSGYIGTLTILK